VHVNGFAALVAALVVESRKHYPSSSLLPHNVPFTLLGAGLLWFSGFEFQRGQRAGGQPFSGTRLYHNVPRAHGDSCRVDPAQPIAVGLVAVTPAAGFVDRSAPSRVRLRQRLRLWGLRSEMA
jgi:Amt family ammonium transporter